MDTVVVRTKLQAAIVRRMAELGLIGSPIHLVIVQDGARGQSMRDIEFVCSDMLATAAAVTRLDRSNPVAFFLRLWGIARSTRRRGGTLRVANLDWFALALTLRITPGLITSSFDDGAANLPLPGPSFLAAEPSRRRSAAGWVSRTLFPRGCAHYVRSLLQRHCTIYRGMPNVVDADRLDYLDMDWRNWISPEERLQLPHGVRRIFLGTVYRESHLFMPQPIPDDQVKRLVAWSDLHIPHPRETGDVERHPVVVRYPAEAVIDHYATQGPVVVAHYNSSAAIPFLGDGRVKLIDLLMDTTFP